MKQLGLDGHVNLTSGNFIDIDSDTYDVVFCDAVHEPNEIEANLPHIIAHSNSKCIWVFHDMDETNVNHVIRLAECEYTGNEKSLGVFFFKK